MSEALAQKSERKNSMPSNQPDKFREVKTQIENLFEEKSGIVLIGDVITHFCPDRKKGLPLIKLEEKENSLIVNYQQWSHTYPLFVEPRTGKKFLCGYFPVEVLTADIRVNPRQLILNRLLKLTQAFMEGETRFQSTIGRFVKAESDSSFVISIFDGSHGAAADLFTSDSKEILCKLYLPGQLTDQQALHWNNDAHSVLRQQEFRGQVLVKKRTPELYNRLADFLRDPGFTNKTERVFIKEYVSSLERHGMQEAIVDEVIYYVLYSDQEVDTADGGTQVIPLCMLTEFVNLEDQARRGGKQLSFNLLKSTLFKDFISSELADFDKAKGAPEDDPRQIEKTNLLRLCNLLAKHTLKGKWSQTVEGTKRGTPTKDANRSENLWKKGAVRFWSPVLRSAIGLILGVSSTDTSRIFQLRIKQKEWEQIEDAIIRLFNYGAWESESVARLLNANQEETTRKALEDWSKYNDKPMFDEYYLADKKRRD